MTKTRNTTKIKAGQYLITSIKNKDIIVDRRTNHGNDFRGAYEKLHMERFFNYLGSSSRYLTNKNTKESGYYG